MSVVTQNKQRYSRKQKGVRVAFIVLLTAIGLGIWALYNGITTSLMAEENLHATLFTVRLIEQYVATKGHWPQSWEQLEGLPFPSESPVPVNGLADGVVRIGGQHGFDWPDASPEIRQRVHIDFQADPVAIAEQDPRLFTAIKPIGPYYEYRHYGFVESLQATIRKAATNEARHVKE